MTRSSLIRIFHITSFCLLALMLLAVATTTANAQTPLQAQVALRPLSPEEITNYKLPATTQKSAGLTTLGLGEPAYLEAQVNSAFADSDIVGVTWTLTLKPSGSAAKIETSPLGGAVPLFEPSDRTVAKAAGRAMLRPDVPGQYIVTAAIATRTGTTTLGQTLIAGTYVGIKACTACHSGGLAEVKTPDWSKTLHAQIFQQGVDGIASDHYAASCLSCHTVGFDTDPAAANGAFDDVAAKLNWTLPAVLKPGTFDAMPAELKNLGNIQCENCHGPGSQHAKNGGSTLEISIGSNTGVCGQCHGAATHHIKNTEWNNSMHAVTTRDPSGAGRESCVGCHTGTGFVNKAKSSATVDTTYTPINCQTCHEPHGQTAPKSATHLVRKVTSLALADGTTVSKGGNGLICMNCHQSRQNAAVYAATTAGSARFGPHHGPQADMLAGANGFTYNRKIPSSAHRSVVEDSCVTCHMQATATTDAAFTLAGGHTFKPSWVDAKTQATGNLTGACQTCHGEDVTSFDFPLFDYNGDGKIEGVQTEVKRLLDQLSALLPPAGKPKTDLTIDSTWTRGQLEAAYNWQFVAYDGSFGVHNTAYAVGLLKASIADLGGSK